MNYCLILAGLFLSPQEAIDVYGDPLPRGALARIGTVRLQHGEVISGLAFSPDSQRIAAVAHDGKLRVWECATGTALFTLNAADNRFFYSVAWSPDNRSIVSGEFNGTTLRFWDAFSGKSLRTRETSPLYGDIEFSRNGNWLAWGNSGKAVQTLNLKKGVAGPAVGITEAPGHDLSFVGRGHELVLGTYEGTATLWSLVQSEKPMWTAGASGSIYSVSASPDGQFVALAGNLDTVILLDGRNGKEIRKVGEHKGSILATAFSSDSKRIACGVGRSVEIYNVGTGEKIFRSQSLRGEVTELKFSPDGRLLASGAQDGQVRFWNAVSGERQGMERPTGHKIIRADLSSDAEFVVTAGNGNDVTLWDATKGIRIRELYKHRFRIMAVAFSPDAKIVACGAGDQVLLLDRRHGRVLRRMELPSGGISACAFSPDGALLAARTQRADTAVWNVSTGTELWRMKGFGGGGISYYNIAFSSDGTLLAGASKYNSGGQVWEAATGREVLQLNEYWEGAMGIAFSPKGDLVAGAGKEGTVFLWNLKTGLSERKLLGHRTYVVDLAFSPDGSLLASASTDQSVRIWSVDDGKTVRVIREHQGHVKSVKFSKDGKRLSTASVDGTVLIWDCDALLRLGPVDAPEMRPLDRTRWWELLAAPQASTARRVTTELLETPDQVAPFLRARLFEGAKSDLVAKLIEQLDSDRIEVRQDAYLKLLQHGDEAEPPLRSALDDNPSRETGLQIRRLLTAIDAGLPRSPRSIRRLRVVRLLERLATEDGKELLRAGVSRFPCKREREAAREALSRLERSE